MISIITTKNLSQQHWNAFYIFSKQHSLNNDIGFSYNFTDFIELFSKINATDYIENFLVCNHEIIFGRIELHSTDANKKCDIRLILLNQPMNKNIRDCLINWINSKKNRFNIIRIETDVEEISSLLENNRFILSNSILDLRLKKSNFLSNIENKKIASGFSLEVTDKFTNQEIEELTKLYNTCLQEMIKHGNYLFSIDIIDFKNFILDLSKYDKNILLAILKNKDGMIAGFSGLTYKNKNNDTAEHFFTCIHKVYRGNNLSQIIKIELYSNLFSNKNTIETIRTECFEANLPITQTNFKIGFKMYKKIYELVSM